VVLSLSSFMSCNTHIHTHTRERERCDKLGVAGLEFVDGHLGGADSCRLQSLLIQPQIRIRQICQIGSRAP
jgi:hypothetical protein